METFKNLLKRIRSKWHSDLLRQNRSIYAFCQNEFLLRQNVPFKSLPAYRYYEHIHRLLTIYEIPAGGVLCAE